MPRSSSILRTLLAFATVAIFSACAAASRGPAGGMEAGPIDPSAGLSGQVALVRADSAWNAGAYDIAAVLYQVAATKDPSNSRAVFRLATLRSWDNQLDEGVRLFRRYVALEPGDTEGRVALARALAWQGNYSAAIAIYDSVLTKDKTYRDAVLGRAQTMAWAGNASDAIAVYKQWSATHPTDRPAALEYARALALDGQLGKAEQLYSQLARTGDADATKGLARVIAWRGDLPRSERVWRDALDIRPNDAEALTGLAQILRWQGRQSDAETALQGALHANPAYGEARALLRWVEADLRPSASVTASNSNDSDHNKVSSVSLDYVQPGVSNTIFGAKYVGRMANFSAIDSRSNGISGFARWQPGVWQIRADAGVTRLSSTLVTSTNRTIGSGALHGAGAVGRALSVGFGASRAPFDETALLIANGVISSEYTGEAALELPARFTLSGAASHARLTGGSRENSRNAFSSTLRWTQNRKWSVAVGARHFGYDTTSTDGYFAPRKYTLAEVSGRGRLGGELGWNGDADVGLGSQDIEFFGATSSARLAERAALSIGYRFDPSRELMMSGGYANVAGPAQTSGSEYHYYSFALRARVGF